MARQIGSTSAYAPGTSLLGVDGKWNFVKGRVDLAIDPGIQGTYVVVGSNTGNASTSGASAAIFYGNLPLLVGINFSSRIAMMLSPGIGFAAATGSNAGQYAGGSSFLARMGMGFNFKIANSFALQPEVTALYYTNTGGVMLSTGLGFVIGAQPDTSDLK